MADLGALPVFRVAGDFGAQVAAKREFQLDAAVWIVVVGLPAARQAAGANRLGVVALESLCVFGSGFREVFGACGGRLLGSLLQRPGQFSQLPVSLGFGI